MTQSQNIRLSSYEPIQELNRDHHVTLVRHVDTGLLYVRKELERFNPHVYDVLMNHTFPGIPRIYECVSEDDHLILIEEYVNGNTLEELLNAGKTFSAEEIYDILLQLCEILAPVHALNPPLIHRDIKPSNIIWYDNRKVILLDFNAAKVYHPEKSMDTEFIGTPRYAAPEQYGFSQSDARTDIYAIGVLASDLRQHIKLSESYFNANSSQKSLAGMTGQREKAAKALSVLNDIICRCTSIDPVNRYQSVEELHQILKQMKQRTDSSNKKMPDSSRRSLKMLKDFLSIPVYLFFLYAGMTATFEQTSPSQQIVDRFCMTLFFVSALAILFNTGQIHRYLPILKKCTKWYSRALIIALYVVIFLFFWICICVLIQAFLPN